MTDQQLSFSQRIARVEQIRNSYDKKPEFTLLGVDGNAFVLMGTVMNAMRRARWSVEHREEVLELAKMGDYTELVSVLMACGDSMFSDDADDEDDDDEEMECSMCDELCEPGYSMCADCLMDEENT